MGEAKWRRAELRDSFLRQADRWSFPETDWERGLALELSGRPVLRVPRAPDSWLQRSRMVPQRCHENVSFVVENYADCEHVTGWWPQDGNFVLHSVVRQGARLMCVTPLHSSGWGAPGHIDFIPDPRIEWRPEDDGPAAYVDGMRLEVGVRSDPAETMRRVALVRERLLAGVHPYQAVLLTVPDATAST